MIIVNKHPIDNCYQVGMSGDRLLFNCLYFMTKPILHTRADTIIKVENVIETFADREPSRNNFTSLNDNCKQK